MKYVLFISFVVVTYVRALPSDEITVELLDKTQSQCLKELNNTGKALTTVEERKRFDYCMMLCIGNNIGFLNKDGLFNIEKSVKFIEFVQKANNDTQIDMPATKTIIEFCNKNRQIEKDECLALGKLVDCLSDKMKEQGLSFF